MTSPLSPLHAAVVQWAPGGDVNQNREAARSAVARAAASGAQLVVLPEYSQFSHPRMADAAAGAAEDLDGPFVSALRWVAASHGVVVIAGLVERSADAGADPRPSNTVVAVDGDGILAAYRKIHLYDAFGMRESDWLRAGDVEQSPVLEVRGLQVGLQTCYDLRFPEASRRLVDAGAEVLVVPAQWVRGPQKEHHWRTLLAARAIENGVHVLAADHSPTIGAGCSSIIDPMGVTIAGLGEQEGIAHAVIDPARTAEVRRMNPALENRRFSVVPR